MTAADPAAENNFGYSVSINGNYVVSGAYRDDVGASNSGAAYIFKRETGDTWTQKAKIKASDAAANDYFGHSVSVSGDYAVVGAYQDDDDANDSGSAYIFKRESGDTWTQKAKIKASDPENNKNFGYSVSINGNYAVVGAPRDSQGYFDSGALYVFKREVEAWSYRAKLKASDVARDDKFGYSASINGNYIVSGAPYNDSPGENKAGANYVFGGILGY